MIKKKNIWDSKIQNLGRWNICYLCNIRVNKKSSINTILFLLPDKKYPFIEMVRGQVIEDSTETNRNQN